MVNVPMLKLSQNDFLKIAPKICYNINTQYAILLTVFFVEQLDNIWSTKFILHVAL